MRKSRLSRKLEKQTEKTIFLSILGIVAVILFVVKVAVPLLVNLSLSISDSKTSEQKKDLEFLSPPILAALPNATNSAEIKISGTSATKGKIALYVNDSLKDKTDVKKDGTFSFENVNLSSGNNTIKAKIETDKGKSSFSNPISIAYRNKAPSLSLNTPSDNQSFSKDENSVDITGKTDPGVKITVNDFWAIVDNDGNFSYKFSLKNGENKIQVIAVDEAGNKAQTEKKVTYSP